MSRMSRRGRARATERKRRFSPGSACWTEEKVIAVKATKITQATMKSAVPALFRVVGWYAGTSLGLLSNSV